ncbi:uncharacterized protein LOC119721120 [Patiria miniata]|uniref:Uncharacterized protein n=1 Tax=Patiria miniata TaxID=46514 RepID=A0A913Z5B0_PATMI|nr:uncharacterized protein LOC119721120 [Patiria miniata]
MVKKKVPPTVFSSATQHKKRKKKYSKGFLKSPNRAARVQKAVHQVVHENIPIKRAARQNSLSYGFLHRRISGDVDVESRNGPPTMFSVEEERSLSRWLSEMAKRGMGLSPGEFLDFVEEIIKKEKSCRNFKSSRPSYTWYYSFMARNSDVVERRKEASLESSRIKVTQSKLDRWFDSYYQFVSSLNLLDKPHRIWNADETGFQMGSKSGHVIGPTTSEYTGSLPHLTGGSTKQRLTVMYCGNAEGELMPPFFVFPKPRPTAYDPLVGSTRGSAVTYTKKGWMNGDTFSKFLDHFDRNAGPERPVILLIDSASCHIDVNTFDYAVAHGIEIYRIVPNATHLMQPMDVGIFGPLKRQWNLTVKKNTREQPGDPINKATFPAKLHETVLAFYKPLTVMNSFKSSGIYPINREAISNEKLKPSLTFKSKTPQDEPSTSVPSQRADDAFQVFRSVLDEATVTEYEKRMSLAGGDDDAESLPLSPRFRTYKQLKMKTGIPRELPKVSAVQQATEYNIPCGLSMLVAAVDHVTSEECATPENTVTSSQPCSQATISNTLEDALTFPQAVPTVSRSRRLLDSLPDNLTSPDCLRRMALHQLEKVRHKAKMEHKAKQRYLQKKKKENKSTSTGLGEYPQDHGQGAETLCPVCNVSYEANVRKGDNLMWIQCDECLEWMHQKCIPSSLAYDQETVVEDTNAKFVCHKCAV